MIYALPRAIVASALTLALLLPAPSATACGPFSPSPIFTGVDLPDLPPQDFAAGRIGIVPPKYQAPYLVVAYRYFSGRPLNAQEQRQFVKYWNHFHEADSYGPLSTAGEDEWNAALASWRKSSHQSSAQAPLPRNPLASLPRSYEQYGNCLDDAYRTATRTLAAREQEFGVASPAVKSWADAQVRVFENCDSGTTGDVKLPDPAADDLPPAIRDDREYQTAAAYFYGGNWDEAEARFRRIAEGKTSSWVAVAALVAARCELRRATIAELSPAETTESLNNAEAQLDRLIADPGFASVKPSAERLRAFTEIRLHPVERMIELSGIIERGEQSENLAQNLIDYEQLLNQQSSSLGSRGIRDKSAMLDWIYSYAIEDGPGAEEHRIARWRETQSPAWLVAALESARSHTPDWPELVVASLKVPADSPASLTLAFNRDRFLAANGNAAQARADLNRILLRTPNRLPPGARNQFLALRMKLARNLDELLADAPRTPTGLFDGYDEEPQPAPKDIRPMFDKDASHALSAGLPLSALVAAARSDALPPRLRRYVAIAAWSRAVLLNRDATAKSLAQDLVRLAPSLADEFGPYLAAQDFATRKFAAAEIVLRTPGMRPYVDPGYGRLAFLGADDERSKSGDEDLLETDSYRNNWWCELGQPGPHPPPVLGDSLGLIYGQGEIPDASFLSAAEKRTLAEETAALQALPPGPVWMADQVLARAKTLPHDPNLPEALHLVVHMTRYSCYEQVRMGSYSRKAFELLHRRFPKSEWAAKTPYWFN
jgi:hypothetical protein